MIQAQKTLSGLGSRSTQPAFRRLCGKNRLPIRKKRLVLLSATQQN
ncbi:MAG TPA: hypothetical protein VF798_09215 [Burkholderiaceae bacterium]